MSASIFSLSLLSNVYDMEKWKRFLAFEMQKAKFMVKHKIYFMQFEHPNQRLMTRSIVLVKAFFPSRMWQFLRNLCLQILQKLNIPNIHSLFFLFPNSRSILYLAHPKILRLLFCRLTVAFLVSLTVFTRCSLFTWLIIWFRSVVLAISTYI